MPKPKDPNSPDKRTRIHARVDPGVHREFKAVAGLLGMTLEQRIEYLMTEDVESHRDILRAEAVTSS